jgi:hypothetical protein
MGEERAPEAPPDVLRIMAKIHASLEQKVTQGIYTDSEADALAEKNLRSYSEDVLIDPRLVEWLHGPGAAWNISPDYAIQTTRTGPVAWLLVTAKKLVRPIVRLYTDPILVRQAQLNVYLVRLLHQNIREAARLDVQLRGLRQRVQALQAARAGRPLDSVR